MKISTFNYMQRISRELKLLVSQLEADSEDVRNFNWLVDQRKADRVKELQERLETIITTTDLNDDITPESR